MSPEQAEVVTTEPPLTRAMRLTEELAVLAMKPRTPLWVWVLAGSGWGAALGAWAVVLTRSCR
jgi:hypothetical protein